MEHEQYEHINFLQCDYLHLYFHFFAAAIVSNISPSSRQTYDCDIAIESALNEEYESIFKVDFFYF